MAMKKCPDCKNDGTADKLYDKGHGKCKNCKYYDTFMKINSKSAKFEKVPMPTENSTTAPKEKNTPDFDV